jgi:hypothetical protein
MTLSESFGMETEAYKMHHLGVNYQIRRSTISDANNRRSSDFFKDIYFIYMRNINIFYRTA